MLLWRVASEDLAVDISSIEVVPFMLVPMYIHSHQAKIAKINLFSNLCNFCIIRI